MPPVIKVSNLSKQYRLGQVGTGTISHDVNRWWHKIRGKEDPYLKIGESNDRTVKGESDYVWALKDINFEVQQGEVLGIIGRNGAGKSTLLKILSRTTSPSTGSVKLKGRVASLLEVGTGFHPELSGRDNIYLNGAILGMTRQEIKRKFDEIVDFAGVERYIDTPVKRYSSGMYVRLAFGVAAHLESEILIVDEVLAVGDAEFQKKCLGKMKEVSEGQGRTVLFVSHNMQAVSRLCTKSILIRRGELDTYGDTTNIIEKYSQQKAVSNEIFLENKELVKYISIYQIKDIIKLNCHYCTEKIFEIPHFGFIVSDIYGNRIFGSNPSMQPPKKPFLKVNEGIIEVVVTYPKLLNGLYNLSVWFGDGRIDYFSRENILTFEVVNMTLNESEIDIKDCGPVLPIIDWNQFF